MIMTCCPMKYCILHDWLSYASIVYTNANIKISLLLICSCNYMGHEWGYRYASSCVCAIDMETLST